MKQRGASLSLPSTKPLTHFRKLSQTNHPKPLPQSSLEPRGRCSTRHAHSMAILRKRPNEGGVWQGSDHRPSLRKRKR